VAWQPEPRVERPHRLLNRSAGAQATFLVHGNDGPLDRLPRPLGRYRQGLRRRPCSSRSSTLLADELVQTIAYSATGLAPVPTRSPSSRGPQERQARWITRSWSTLRSPAASVLRRSHAVRGNGHLAQRHVDGRRYELARVERRHRCRLHHRRGRGTFGFVGTRCAGSASASAETASPGVFLDGSFHATVDSYSPPRAPAWCSGHHPRPAALP